MGKIMNSDPFSLRAFEDEVARGLRRTAGECAKVLLAVSGGPDSIALLWSAEAAAQRLKLTLEVATVDHGLRPEAKGEAAFVLEVAKAAGLPGHGVTLALEPGPGAPERARTARYQALERVRQERGLDFIATAHTASDQAETLLMRLGRGASLRGARAIRERRDRLVRPMLAVTRPQVLAYLAARSLRSVEDPTNADPAYLRSRVRAELLPLFQQLMGEKAAQQLAHFARVAEEDDQLLTELAVGGVDLTRPLELGHVRALQLPLRRRLLAAWLEAQGFPVDGALLDDLCLAIEEGRRATLPKDHLLEVRKGFLTVSPAPPRSNG